MSDVFTTYRLDLLMTMDFLYTLHPVPFIRNTVILEIVLSLNFGRNLTSPVAYLFLRF